MEKIKLEINGQQVEADPGQTILEVVREQELDDIPTLCHSPELKPYGSCFVCVVEVEGRGNLVPSCATRVAPDMKVTTRNERIEESRKTALELLMSNHYADCVAPCTEGCPANVDAQGYIALSAMGKYPEAVDLVRESNPLPAVCGRICVRFCEVVCRRADVDAPVAINNIKRFVTDSPGAYEKDPVCEPPTGKTAGIVGAGPAGLTAAWFLARKGIKPVIYEALEKTGGMLRYGIPEYRLPDDVLDKEVDYIRRAGAEIKCGVRVGKDITLDEMRAKHDAVFVGPGAWTGKSMRVEGEFDTEGVVTGADWLPEKAATLEPITGTVLVVGGGNTAMDAARTAWRLNADKVIVVYRRTKNEMPADPHEVRDLLEEGVEIMELVAPISVVKNDDGELTALRCQRMQLGEPDDSGRRRPVPMDGSEFDLPCDLIISAIGQGTVLEGLTATGGDEIGLTRWDTYVVDTDRMTTNIEGVFAGGDAADDGPTVVIDAIRDGQRAARSMAAHIEGKSFPAKPFIVQKEFWAKPGKSELGEIKESPRHEVHLIDIEERKGSFAEVSNGFEAEDNTHETARCLSCGCVRFDDCDLRLQAEEYGVDMERFKGYVRKHKVDERHPYISYDPNKCILCARCVRTCARVLPISALGLVDRGFKTEMRPAMNDPLVETNCVSCGNCIDACPTGALVAKYPFPGKACLATEDVETHCGFCSLGCSTKVRSFADGRYFTKASGEPGEYLCRYGRFGHELFIRQPRLTSALMRQGHQVMPHDMKPSVGRLVEQMRTVARKHGAENVAVFVSPELTNEEFYLAGRIAREGIGTNNVGSLSILSGGAQSGRLDAALGFTASTADRTCLADADLIVCTNTSLEADHLILSVDVIEAVRDRGAKLIVSNSALDPADHHLATLAVDPMRGRGSQFWNAVLQVLIDGGKISPEGLENAEAFLADRNVNVELAAAKSGVDESVVQEAARMISEAKNVVFIHSPDRRRDAAPGDMAIIADLAIMLRKAGAVTEILLPRLLANSAGLEIMGADPAYLVGKVAANVQNDLPGARSGLELREMLENGDIRAALVIGENPLDHERSASWFHNVEFMAAVDWTDTETTSFADITLPGATFLETGGTRCTFEGDVIEFAGAVNPPAGMDGIETLTAVAEKFGLEVADDRNDLFVEIDGKVRAGLGDRVRFYWNTGEERDWNGEGKLIPVESEVQAASILPPLTHSHKYRQEIREVGTERFRVH